MTEVAAVPVDPGPHEWYRLMRGWHVVFAALAVLTGVLLLVDDGIGSARRLVGLAALLLLCVWYAAVGAGALHREPDRRGVAYLTVAAPLTLGLFVASPVGALMLFLLYPHLWALLPLRWAIVGTIGSAATSGLVMLAWSGADQDEVGYLAASAFVALLVAIVLGLWITRVIEQSRRRAELVRELDATRAELAAVSHRSGALAERERLARDIHDTLAQGFTSVLLLLEALEAELGRDERAARACLDRARCTARENLAEARAIIEERTPPQLRDGSLPAALRQVVDRIGPELAGGVTLTVEGTPRALGADQEVVLLRTAQEALSNTRRHAAAGRAEVCLSYQEARVALRVSDDGQGFDAARRTGGSGLDGLRGRVRQVGGSLDLVAAPGSGVTISVELAP